MNTIIQKRTLADEVALQLETQIKAGEYLVGDKLPTEPALMKSFGVGRSSIREAIKMLSNRGLLSVQQGIGTFVESNVAVDEPLGQRLKRADIRDLDEVRKLLELKIAERAALHYTPKDIKKMKTCLERRKETAEKGDLLNCVQADIDFHVAVAAASKNDILLDLYKAASVHMQSWFLKVYQDTHSFTQTQAMHEQLLQCIINRKSKAAWDVAVAIIDHG
ncbi:DNA-binding transcriptional regulator, FadR family [Arachidicoccus rhizosphaerae]|jgi:DNA-binding FadR family transcriptional regulator|uniref:DNA-binding transcriptional regulator, FadR family n=1 Tax=Arachidicoccus rhizosphaerae TaxID=551991 RepID=A0A1H4CWL6_9BACT|nr:FadR/GntR family transcriptional regulator [Arachidicoccus rhizosphaerae]SEA64626.1 DNA-binding transcriptional regulator, FadR family [Arachidicoccus rhizosphaerae]